MSEPFYVGRNNPRFRGVNSSGYLPAIEIDELKVEDIHIIDYVQFPRKRLEQLEGMLLNTRDKLQQHLNYKKKSRYT